MKKTYLLAAASFAVVGTTLAQKAVNAPKMDARETPGIGLKSRDLANYYSFEKAAGDIIFSDDFATGISNWTTSDPQGAIWMADTDGPDGTFAAVDNSDIIGSTTVSNGFVIFDANLANPTAPYIAKVGNLVSPVIDLTGQTDVTLLFEHRYRHCCSNNFVPQVQVSTDGFATFTTFDVTIPGASVNSLPNTTTTKVNLASYLATATNLNNFQFRFRFDGNVPDANSSLTTHYYWQIDDVQLMETHNNDLALQSGFFVAGSLGIPYYFVPRSQQTAITFGAGVKNVGAMSQTNTKLNVTLGSMSAMSPGQTLAVQEFDTLETATITPALMDPASLALAYMVTQDETEALPGDNSMLDANINITNDVYGVDNGTAVTTVSQLASQDGQPLQIGNQMEIMADEEIDAMYIGVGSAVANVGQEIFGRVYLLNTTSQEYEFYAETNQFIITADTVGTMVKLPLVGGPFPVFAGDNLLVVAGHFGGTTEVTFWAAQSVEAGVVLGFNATDALFQLTGPRAMMVRLGMSGYLGTEELEKEALLIGNVFPNPTAGTTTVPVTLQDAADVTLTVTDITGKVVYTQNAGTLTAGAHMLNVDSSEFAAGVYYLNVQAGEGSSTKKFVRK